MCEEYGICQTSTGRLVVSEQSDPFFAPADILMTPTSPVEILAQENLLQKHKEWAENFSTTRSIDKDLYWCRILENSLSDNTSWQNILTSSDNLQSHWHVVGILYHEMTYQPIQMVGFKGTPKLEMYWKSQPDTYKVNTEWKSELNLWTKTILTRGSEFLMAWTIWSQTWSTRSATITSRRPPQRSVKYSRLHSDPRLKQNQEDLQVFAHQGLYLFLKEHGLILNQELNSNKLTQWQKE